MSKGKCNTCGAISACAIMLFGIVGIVLLSQISTKTDNSSMTIDGISKNLNSRGIIEIVGSKNACPTGYKTLFENKFPGTTDVCFCKSQTSGKYQYNTPKSGKCPHGCKFMNLPKTDLKMWRGIILCAKMSEFSYDSYVHTNKDCPSGSRICGRDQNAYLCMKNAYQCPVNYMAIVNSTPDLSKIPGGKIINLAGGRYLVYSNENVKSQIIVETKWSFAGTCMDPATIPIKDKTGLNMFNFYDRLDDTCPSVYGETKDKRWTTMDRYSLAYLFGENTAYFRNLDLGTELDPRYLNQEIVLEKRGYLHFNKKCKWDQSRSSHDNINMMQTSREDQAKSQSYLYGAYTMLGLAIFSALVYFCLALNANKSIGGMTCCCVWLTLLVLIAAALIAAYCFSSKSKVEIDQRKYTSQCLDVGSSKQITNIKSTDKRNLMLGAIALGACLLGAMLLCLNRCCCWVKDKKKKKDKDGYSHHSHSSHSDDDNRHNNNSGNNVQYAHGGGNAYGNGQGHGGNQQNNYGGNQHNNHGGNQHNNYGHNQHNNYGGKGGKGGMGNGMMIAGAGLGGLGIGTAVGYGMGGGFGGDSHNGPDPNMYDNNPNMGGQDPNLFGNGGGMGGQDQGMFGGGDNGGYDAFGGGQQPNLFGGGDNGGYDAFGGGGNDGGDANLFGGGGNDGGDANLFGGGGDDGGFDAFGGGDDGGFDGFGDF